MKEYLDFKETMMSLLYAWNLFKATYKNNIDENSKLFIEFENSLNKIQNKEYCNQIKRIYIIYNQVNKSMELIDGDLYVYTSPFKIHINNMVYPCALLLEEVIYCSIETIRQTALSPIQVTSGYNPMSN